MGKFIVKSASESKWSSHRKWERAVDSASKLMKQNPTSGPFSVWHVENDREWLFSVARLEPTAGGGRCVRTMFSHRSLSVRHNVNTNHKTVMANDICRTTT